MFRSLGSNLNWLPKYTLLAVSQPLTTQGWHDFSDICKNIVKSLSGPYYVSNQGKWRATPPYLIQDHDCSNAFELGNFQVGEFKRTGHVVTGEPKRSCVSWIAFLGWAPQSGETLLKWTYLFSGVQRRLLRPRLRRRLTFITKHPVGYVQECPNGWATTVTNLNVHFAYGKRGSWARPRFLDRSIKSLKTLLPKLGCLKATPAVSWWLA